MDSVGRNEQIVSQIQSVVGDRQELLTELWVSNMGLVQKIIHQATGLQRNVHRQDFEDLEQQAFIGIMEAVRRYDPAAGVKFFTYAESYIRKSIYKYYDKNNLFPILKSNIDNGYAYVVTWEDFLKYASADISIAFEHKDSTPSYKIIKSL